MHKQIEKRAKQIIKASELNRGVDFIFALRIFKFARRILKFARRIFLTCFAVVFNLPGVF